MFNKSLILSLFLFGACTSPSRNVSSISERDITSTAIGVAKHESFRIIRGSSMHPLHRNDIKKPTTRKHRAVRVYFHPVQNERDAYHAVILEYVNLFKMGPKYVASNKMPKLSSKIGFLNQITKRASVYKVTPSGSAGVFDMQKLRSLNGRLVADNSDRPSQLVLSEEELSHPLEGATITASEDGEPVEIYFPREDDKKSHGMQYSLAKFVYNKAKLDSTWRKNYLPGPYLGAYGDKNDEILSLSVDEDKLSATFMINEERSHLSQRKREKQLTNAKSAHIEGDFEAKKLADGLFIFSSIGSNGKGAEHVEDRLALFIDIFDATKSLNQDVVELILINADDAEDFLMYYEHPDNGEGR